MGVNVKIVQRKEKLFKKNLKRQDISSLWEKACVNSYGNKCYPKTGLLDDCCRMEYCFLCDDRENIIQQVKMLNESKEFVLFDRLNYGSGIILWFDNNDICLKMSFPSTLSEINSFYNLIELICKKIGTTKFYRDNENGTDLEDIKDKNKFIELGINDTLTMLKRINEENSDIGINGAINPIFLNKKTIEDFGINLPLEGNMENISTVMKNYEVYMNELQKQDLFYAVFKMYQQENGEINAYMNISEDCDTIIPVKQTGEFYFYAFDTSKISNYYAVLVDEQENFKHIKYSDFIEYIMSMQPKYYDATHIIIRLNKEDIKKIIDNFESKVQ